MRSKRKSIASLFAIIAMTALLVFTATVGVGSGHIGSMRNIRTGLDLSGGVSITYESTDKNPSKQDMDDTIYKLQQRVTSYSTEANVYQQGTNRINVEIPGVTDANEILSDLGNPGSLIFADESWNQVLEGSDVAGAEGVSYTDSLTGQRQYAVQLTLTSEGKEKFAEATKENLNKRIYIIYDQNIVSAPTVQAEITDGIAQITGMTSIEEAQQLASFIRIGSLSLELQEIYSNVVGASMGQDALTYSIYAGAIGIALVMLFMIFAYRISGVAASLALVIFTALDLGFLNAFDMTLTLPGIAGLILTIGMAVDANCIIYMRVREELALGQSVEKSLKNGFHKAFSAIFDGQITTLIAAAILYMLGTGSIKGFAQTLAVGTVLSLFTSLVISRWISYTLYGIGFKDKKLYGKTEHKKIFDFVGKKTVPMILAALLVLSVPAGMVMHNAKGEGILNYGLDFVGGTATTVDFGQDMSLSDLDSQVASVVTEATESKDVQFQKIQNSTQVIIKTSELDVEKREALNTALAEKFDGVDKENITAENISSTISGEMRKNALIAVGISVVCMLLYIFFRFKDLGFAMSAIIALVHDITMVLAYYVWLRAGVNSTFIACMLTILGYSINTTIVIFDRIRENMPAMHGKSLAEVVNTSITQTLTRSLYSNLTTLITITSLYVVAFMHGLESITAFALPITVGLVAGCFSSVLLTGPIYYLVAKKKHA